MIFWTKFWDCWRGRAWEIGNDSGGSGPGSVRVPLVGYTPVMGH
jgi:ESCRT-II complex subunit VPS36